MPKHITEVEVTKVAVDYLRKRTAERFRQNTGDTPLVVPLRVSAEHRAFLLRHPRFAGMDTVDTFHLARIYIKGRLPIPDKETAVAILLSCLGYGQPIPALRPNALQVEGRKFRTEQ